MNVDLTTRAGGAPTVAPGLAVAYSHIHRSLKSGTPGLHPNLVPPAAVSEARRRASLRGNAVHGP